MNQENFLALLFLSVKKNNKDHTNIIL